MTINVLIEKAVVAVMLVALSTGNAASADTAVVTDTTQPEPTTAVTADPTVQDVLLSVCEARGYGEECAKTLLGMVWVESNNISTAIGDQGRARGYFQIWYKLHDVTIACAEDLVCSADWTISYLEQHQYPKYANYAVQCHNSCNAGNGYDAKVARHGERLWNEPMAVSQAAAIDLSQVKDQLAFNE